MRRPREIAVPSFTKINLGLEIVGPRPDGFHEMVTLYQTIGLTDVLRIRARAGRGIALTCSDPSVPTDGRNLVVRAYRAVRGLVGELPGIDVHLVKNAPAGGGLGGGSGNAGAMLLALDHWLGLGLGAARLAPLAAGLGSDVPFFLVGGLALGIRRGELVVPLPDVPRWHVVLVRPAASVSTAAVFDRVRKGWGRDALRPSAGQHIGRFLLDPSPETLGQLRNDLAPAARSLVVGYDGTVRRLRKEGALLALLSGSGSTSYGLFRTGRGARKACQSFTALGTEVTTTVGRSEYMETITVAAHAARGRGMGAASSPRSLGRSPARADGSRRRADS